MRGMEELFRASQDGDLNSVKRLITQGVDVNSQDEMFETPLMKGCREGHLEIVKELINNGANVNQQSTYGVSPLILACEKGYLEIVKELIRNGADVNKKDIAEVTPLMRASNVEIVRELIRNGANVNEKDIMGRTALIGAYQDKNMEIIAELINGGIDISSLSNEEIEILARDNNIVGISIAIRKKDYKTLEECLDKYYENLYNVDNAKEKSHHKKKNKLLRIMRMVKNSKGTKLRKPKIRIGKLLKRVSNRSSPYKKSIVQAIDNREKYLKNTGDALKRIDDTKKYLANLKKCTIIKEQQKEKQELEKDIMDIRNCQYEQNDTVSKIALKRGISLDTSVEDLIILLKEQTQNINMIQDKLKNFSNKIDLDYKQIIFEGINLGKGKNKGVEKI